MPGIPLDPSGLLAWGMASLEACQAGSNLIQPVHLLGALLKILDDVYRSEAEELGFSPESLESVNREAGRMRQLLAISDEKVQEIRRSVRWSYLSGGASKPRQLLHRSPEVRRLFEVAASLAIRAGAPALSTGHLLSALGRYPPAGTEHLLAGLISGALVEAAEDPLPGLRTFGEEANKPRPGTAFDSLGRDLTRLATEGRLAPLVGRHSEILAVVRALHRVSKRSVLVVGEAGVGKTAIVEGLAQHLASKNAPSDLASLRIVELSIGHLIGGTRYRGDLEERLRAVLDEARQDPNLILFLDEIHLAVGGGSGESAVDIANLLKPALGRGDIRCIGATTESEFDRYIKSDAAFMRRFSLVRVREPSREDAMEIVRAWARRIEETQSVVVQDDAIEASIDLSVRFIRDRFLPDKAIELLDSAASRVKVATLSFGAIIPTKEPPTIKQSDVEAVLEEQLGGSATLELPGREDVERTLGEELVGQDEAISQIGQWIDGIRFAPEDQSKPLGVLLLTGPTGVGKTATAEIVGRLLTQGDERGVAKFSMNEYKERHELARLIGAPPGFIGHEAQGSLFAFAHAHPRGVIVLDEAEKAHPEVAEYFQQIFDTGETRDSRGRLVDFRGTLFLLTCNLEAASHAHKQIGFSAVSGQDLEDTENVLRKTLSTYFKPEFLARIDRVVLLRELEMLDFASLLDRQLKRLRGKLGQDHSITLEISPEARAHLLEACADQEEGARGFVRQFERMLNIPLQEAAQGGDKAPRVLRVVLQDQSLRIL